ncbi:hypothetical protein AB433_07545 [Croceicoccus naphthovorans]|uniref:Peptidase S49 domain-containing protein n=2 Tax=Croceicoccus naphthovorans TaxID=1348774 RepID=A0A0G3XGV6_9SPHN|nr:hypothetical protein AB433_07545 [Croceicoccus naphthovorans]
MFNRPLMVTRDRAEIALGVMGPKLNIGALVVSGEESERRPMASLASVAAAARVELDQMPGDASLARRDWDGNVLDPYEVWNGLAVLPVRGTLMAENGLEPFSGATGYDGLSYKLRYAAGDAHVAGVAFDIDSGGGECVDLLELCSQIRSFEKPVAAIIRGTACSAAYAIACSAGVGNVYAPDYARVGHVGAILMHADFSKKLDQDGIAVTMIASGEHKADGNPYQPLGEEIGRKLQGEVDAAAADFIAHVADSRQIDAAAIRAQQARYYTGADSVSQSLVDHVMSWDEAFKHFAQRVNSPASRSGSSAPSGARSARKETAMSNEAPAPAAEQQPGITEAQIAAAKAEGREEGITAGATAERARITELAEMDAGSTISASLGEAIEAGTSAGDFAIGLAKAAKAKQGAALTDVKAEAVPAAALPEGGATAAAPGVKPKANRGADYAQRKAAASA